MSPREPFLTRFTRSAEGSRDAFELGERGPDPRILGSLALVAAIVAADLIAGPEISLIAFLVVAPLATSLLLGPRDTTIVAMAALVTAILLGLPNQFFAESDHLTRILPVGVAGLLSVWAARLRADREHSAALVGVQGTVSRILNESANLSDAAPRLLRAIGEALGWDLGAIWEVEPASQRLRATVFWSPHAAHTASFEEASRSMTPARGVGLPGRVLERGGAIVVPELRRDPEFRRPEPAEEAGLESALAFPIGRGGTVVGVVELFSRARRRPNRAQIEMLGGLGRQIGQFIERTRVEDERTELLESEHAARLSAERAERANAETVALLDTLLGRAPVGFGFVGPDLCFQRVNDALAAAEGRRPEELVGRPVDELGELPELATVLRRVLATGEPLIDTEMTGKDLSTGLARQWLTSYYPVRGTRSEVLGVGVVAVEITERKRAETRTRLLAEATATLNASLDYETTLVETARIAVRELADICVIDLVHSGGRIRRLAIVHTDDGSEGRLRELERRHPPDPGGAVGPAATLRTGESQLHAPIDDAVLRIAARDEEHLAVLRELGLDSAIIVPLAARGRTLGAMTLATAGPGRRFDRDDLALAEELGRQAGAAVDNARLYEDRSHIARTLQASLLPPRLPKVPGLELAARYRAVGEVADVGGDFYDVFKTGESTWAAVVGDVLGKGPTAAALIGLARHTLRAAAMRDSDPARILATLNEALYREGDDESFLTAVYMTIDLAGAEVAIELTSAGHPLPLVLRGDGSLETVGRPGTLLGAIPRLSLQPERVELAHGDALVAFTDGVPEARSDQGIFGERRLQSLLASLSGATARELAERIEQDAVAFQSGQLRDDLAVLAMRRTGDTAQAGRALGTRPLEHGVR